MFENAREIQRRHMANGEGGFTLIELLIVIVVLGILAAIVVFALGGVTGQSAIAACTSDAKTVSIAVSAYQAQTGNTPGGAEFATSPITDADLVPTYLKSWPSNPSYYQLTLDGSGNVEVALNTNDPGAASVAAGAGVGAALAGVALSALPGGPTYALPAEFEGSSIYAFPSTAPTALVGQGICQGA